MPEPSQWRGDAAVKIRHTNCSVVPQTCTKESVSRFDHKQSKVCSLNGLTTLVAHSATMVGSPEGR